MATEQSPGAIKKGEPTSADPRELFNEFIASLEIPDEVKTAFAVVDRAEFAPPSARKYAYIDKVIPLGEGSSISQPSLVAQMIALSNPKPGDRSLEIGTATGYQASVLSQIVDHVDTIEVNTALAEQARENLERLGYDGKVTVHLGDGTKGLEGQQFNNIIVTAALKEMPQALIDQLAPGGIMVAPVGAELAASNLVAYLKDEDGNVASHELGLCQFVPIKTEGQGGWTEEDIKRSKSVHYIAAWHHHIESIGKSPEEEMKRLRSNIARVLGRKTPLTEGKVIEIGMLISDTNSPTTKGLYLKELDPDQSQE